MNPNHGHCCTIGCYGSALLIFGLNQKSDVRCVCVGGGGG